MKVEEFLDVSDFINYMALDEEDCCLSVITDKYNIMKSFGLEEIHKIDYKFITSKNTVGVVCMVHIKTKIKK